MLINQYYTSNFYLEDWDTTTYFFQGNGTSSYTVRSAVLTCGDESVSIKCLGKTSFIVPAGGRVSDTINLSTFTLPGSASLAVSIRGDMPVVSSPEPSNVGGNTVNGHTIITSPGPISNVSGTKTTEHEVLFLANFETNLLDEVGGLSPSTYYYGTSSFTITIVDNDGLYDYIDSLPPPYTAVVCFSLYGAIDGSWVAVEINFSNTTSYLRVKVGETASITAKNLADHISSFYLGYWHANATGSVVTVTPLVGGLTSFISPQYYVWHVYVDAEQSTQLFSRGVDGGKFGTGYLNSTIPDTFNDICFDYGIINCDDYTFHYWVYAADTWRHVAQIRQGSEKIKIYIDGSLWLSTDDTTPGFLLLKPLFGSSGYKFDAIEVLNYAKWTTDFTPPIIPHSISDGGGTITTTNTTGETAEIYSTETITVSDNDGISVGDTLTINLGSESIVFTFVVFLSGGNEILIGASADLTAVNIATSLNDCFGAIFSATTENSVVTVIDYTNFDVTKSTTATGLALSSPIQSVIYSGGVSSSIPNLKLTGYGNNYGLLGDYYGLSQLPKLTCSGTAIRSGNVGNSLLPVFECTGQSFLPQYNNSSTDAEKISLLLCGNTVVEQYAEYFIAEGTYDEIALQVVRFVADYINYIAGDIGDTWNDPLRTLSDGYGDCEDGAFLTYSLIRNMGVPYTNIRLYIGEYYGVGHAWVAYRRDSDSQWVYLDWTLGSAYWLSITSVDSLTAMYNVIHAQYDLGEGFGEASDAHPYGSATSYINCAQVVSLFGYGYLDSLYSDEQHSTLSKELWPLSFISVESNIGATLDAELFGEVYSGIYSTARSSTDGKIVLDKDIPRITISSSSHQEYYSVLNKNIPSIELTAFSYQESASTVDKAILPIRISAVCYGDTYCTVDESIGAITIVSNIIVTGTCTFNKSIPAIHISARMQTLATDTFALCLNTKNNGLSKYTSYNYNSVCMFNGKMIGAKATGVYELEGNTDDGTAISWKLRTPQIRLEDQRLREIYLHGKITGDVKTILEEPDGTRYEYDIELYSDYVDRVRTKVGKNFRPPYVIVEFMNESDQRCVIDEIRGEGMKT